MRLSHEEHRSIPYIFRRSPHVQPSPGPRSATWQTVSFVHDPIATLQRYARRYGDPFTLKLFTGPIVLTGAPEGIREILTAAPQTFASNSASFLTSLTGEHSVLLLDGEAHKRERAVLMPPFHGTRLKTYGRVIQEVALSHAAAWTPGQAFRMQAFMQTLSLEVIIRTIFGARDQERVRALASIIPAYFKAYTALLVYFPPLRRSFAGLGPWNRFTQIAGRVDQLLLQEISARRHEGGEREES